MPSHQISGTPDTLQLGAEICVVLSMHVLGAQVFSMHMLGCLAEEITNLPPDHAQHTEICNSKA